MVTPKRPARDLKIKQTITDTVAAHGFGHHHFQGGARHRHLHFDLAERAFEAVEMFLHVEETTVRDSADFIDGVAELQSAVFDMYSGLAVARVVAVHISDAARRAPCIPTVAQALKDSRPTKFDPTPSDLSLRCNAERSIPMKAAVREILPPKRLICATR